MYRALGYIATFVFKIFARLTIINKELLPKTGGFVITCSHTGWVDVVALALSVFPRPVHYMAKKELFENSFSGWFLRKLHAFPVDRKNPGPSSIKIPIKILKEEKIVGIFPSGTRTTEDVPLKRGAVTIANMAKVPIVPAYYKGPNTLKELFKGKKAMLIIGEPIFLEKTETNKVDLQYYTNQLSHVFSELEKKLQEYQK